MMSNSKLGEKLLSFAVIADSHLNPDEVDCNSPFNVNKLANRRLRHVINDLNQQDIEFILHLGDLIHPVPAVEELYLLAARRFKEQQENLKKPMHLVPGNHDIGDKPMRWSPAGNITSDYISLWQKNFGPDYYSFSHDNFHFVVINTQLCNSELAEEKEQERWLQKELEENRNKRIFLSTHYPPFLHTPNEEEHYDNIAEPARTRLLNFCERYEVEALFAGHVHNFWYLQHRKMSCYLLPSTAFVRQDYSEMLQAPPSDPQLEAGRNDFSKLGYFLVHLYEHGHAVQMVRTYGELCSEEGCDSEKVQRISLKGTKETWLNPLGFDLRGDWAVSRGIAPSGGLDEFDRKRVFNDYPLLGLNEMGVKKLRIPFQDLKDEQSRSRMRDYIQLGFEFVLFSYSLPDKHEHQLVEQYHNLLESWEITCRISEMIERQADHADFIRNSPLPTYLGSMWEHTNSTSDKKPYYHVINHGFTPSDLPQIKELVQQFKVAPGLVFRLSANDEPYSFIKTAAAIGQQLSCPISVHLRLAHSNPALAQEDDNFVTNRLLEAAIAALPYPQIRLFSDTLVDVDRGYFPRHGVLDSLCNPRNGAKVLMHFNGVINTHLNELPTSIEITTEKDARWFALNCSTVKIRLGIPTNNSKTTITIPKEFREGVCACVDLINGKILKSDTTTTLSEKLNTSSPGNPVALIGPRLN